jgi:hypothetical protein
MTALAANRPHLWETGDPDRKSGRRRPVRPACGLCPAGPETPLGLCRACLAAAAAEYERLSRPADTEPDPVPVQRPSTGRRPVQQPLQPVRLSPAQDRILHRMTATTGVRHPCEAAPVGLPPSRRASRPGDARGTVMTGAVLPEGHDRCPTGPPPDREHRVTVPACAAVPPRARAPPPGILRGRPPAAR